jgi:hypothetical protein
MWVPTTVMLVQAMGELINGGDASVSLLGSCSLGLLRAPFAPTRDSNFAAVTEANFDGYVRRQSGLDGPVIGQGGLALGFATQLWEPSGSDTPNMIYGHMLCNGSSDSPTLLAVEMFDAPIPLTSPLTFIMDTVLFGLDPAANYGKSSISF